MRTRVFLLLAMTVAQLGCQKVDPSVFALGSAPPGPEAPPDGRVTLGSHFTSTPVNGYRLKGRVTFVEPPSPLTTTTGGLRLRGNVQF